MGQNRLKPGIFWWIRQILLLLTGSFFVYFGIEVLKSSYRLNDPFSFILAFFSSNLIILISAVLVLGFIFRIKSVLGYKKAVPKDPPVMKDEHEK